MTEHHVIVGAGQAAIQAATSLRSEGHAGPIVILGDEDAPPYQRPPLSKKFLLGEVGEDRLHIKPAAFYESEDVSLRLSACVEWIDRKAQWVELRDGARIGYDKLLLATGSRPRKLPCVSESLPGVHYLRSIRDVVALAPALRAATRLLVIGGGYIGLEVAAVARQLGLEVEVLEAADRLLARVAGPAISEFFARLHAERGVRIRLGATFSEMIERDGRVAGVRLTDGQTVEADVVLAGIGAVPNVELASKAGLKVENGIVVDALARTSDPKIFAAGDCSSHPSALYDRMLRLESVPNAIEQAKTAAASMCGKHKPYNQTPWFWSDQYEVKFQAAGLIDGHDEARVERSGPLKLAVSYFRAGHLIAVEAVNDPAAFMSARRSIVRAATIQDEESVK